MFGNKNNNTPAMPERPLASDVAKIQSGGLVQIIITKQAPFTFFCFVNSVQIPQEEITGVSIDIRVPDSENARPVVRAFLNRMMASPTGERSNITLSLFPATIQLVAEGRRVVITAEQEGSLEGLFISLGLLPDGTSNEVSGASSFQFILESGIVSCKLTWEDGVTEDLLPD